MAQNSSKDNGPVVIKLEESDDPIEIDLTALKTFPVVIVFGELKYLLVKSMQGRLLLNRPPL